MAARLLRSHAQPRARPYSVVDRGLPTRRRGVGTIVSQAKFTRPMELTSS